MKLCKRSAGIGLGLLLWLTPALARLQSLEPKIAREGGYWVQSVEKAEPAKGAEQLRISSPGPVSVKGAAVSGFRYTLTKRVKADSEKEALKRFQEFEVRTSTWGGVASLAVRAPRRSNVSLQVSAPKTLKEVRVETQGGQVDGSGFDGAFYAETGGGLVRLDRIGGSVTARSGGGLISLGTVGGRVHGATGGGNIRAVMIRGEATLETAGGEIVIDEVAGPLRALTAAGGIRVLFAGDTVVANTAGGSIEVRQARGAVKAESGGGSIQVGAASGVRCETGSGGIRLENVSGSIRAATGVGAISAQLLAGALFSESALTTGLGDITVLIPSKLAVTIRAHNLSVQSGRHIISEFPGLAIRLEDGMAVAEGALNGGGPVLRLTGSGGTIFIRRQE